LLSQGPVKQDSSSRCITGEHRYANTVKNVAKSYYNVTRTYYFEYTRRYNSSFQVISSPLEQKELNRNSTSIIIAWAPIDVIVLLGERSTCLTDFDEDSKNYESNFYA
jgi:hypothetical protein